MAPEFLRCPAVSCGRRLGVDVEEGGGPLVSHPDLGGLDVDAEGDHGRRIGVAEGVESESLEPRRFQCGDPHSLAPVGVVEFPTVRSDEQVAVGISS